MRRWGPRVVDALRGCIELYKMIDKKLISQRIRRTRQRGRAWGLGSWLGVNRGLLG